MSGLYQIIAKDAEGNVTLNTNARGACTGVFQGGHRLQGATVVEVSFAGGNGDVPSCGRDFIRRLPDVKLLKSLVPGLSLKEDASSEFTFVFPGIDTLPADQVITAMRLIKSWVCDYHRNAIRALIDHEPTLDEMFVLGSFVLNQTPISDSYPVLALATLSMYDEMDLAGYNWGSLIYNAKRAPRAGALLPLIRGEIVEGWQTPLATTGYQKEHCILSQIYRDDEYDTGIDYAELCGPEGCPSVNHPLLHNTDEVLDGPVLLYDNNSLSHLNEIADWVFEKLNK